MSRDLTPRCHSPAAVAVLLNFGISKVKMKIAIGEPRSTKDGKHRRSRLARRHARFAVTMEI
ncbi:hypothetical protein ACN263_07500 [Micromonospora sp. WMMD729]|uniref:hypothetical protein n=1 Tax=unclassified Micromonospora TaxID=2617518 RepID=UPI003BF46859